MYPYCVNSCQVGKQGLGSRIGKASGIWHVIAFGWVLDLGTCGRLFDLTVAHGLCVRLCNRFLVAGCLLMLLLLGFRVIVNLDTTSF
jgi:hypothetical protein